MSHYYLVKWDESDPDAKFIYGIVIRKSIISPRLTSTQIRAGDHIIVKSRTKDAALAMMYMRSDEFRPLVLIRRMLQELEKRQGSVTNDTESASERYNKITEVLEKIMQQLKITIDIPIAAVNLGSSDSTQPRKADHNNNNSATTSNHNESDENVEEEEMNDGNVEEEEMNDENVEEEEINDEINSSDNNALITNGRENVTVNTVQHRDADTDEWVPIGSGLTKIHRDEYKKVNWRSYTIATRTLLCAVFPRRILATHSLTGKKSPAFQDKPAKICLDTRKTSDVIIEIMNRFKIKRNLIRNIITIKCADECKMKRTRDKKNADK